MLKKLFATGVAATLAAAMAPQIASGQDFVRIATAGSGGNYYRLGGGLASIYNNVLEGTQASIQATGGSVENLDLLADQEVEVAYLTGSVGQQAYTNTGQFADRPEGRYEGLRAIATVYPNPQWFIAIDEDIQSMQDLEGKRVSVGTQGGTGETWWRSIMEHLGWTYEDIHPEFTVHQSAIDQVRNRQIDAMVWPDAPGSASIQQVADTGMARALDVDEDVIEAMTADSLDYAYTMPASANPFGEEEIKTFASPITFATHSGMSEDQVYELTKAMFENKEELIKVHPLAEYMTLENATDGLPFPLHPGAERYFREQGVM
ncbi:TAXI family TRAP transporter solute-binding subunit [Chelativorans sp. YIM 93263]|uniref:TAXI family TRAP transporter solute-binding subunit n=1 Tax=Chelativorans sp. YIM 93263 TaxID=2906648 RepID=UPI002378C3EC|nr:TAXI family TRAP transporter solute-binding subunit [Chelativorans sp. YIM 93263]